MSEPTLPFPTPSRTDDGGRRAVARRLGRAVGSWPVDRPDHVSRPPAALAPFVAAGVLTAPDVHVAEALARRCGDDRDEVLLATALAVRAPRRSHVCVDIVSVHAQVVSDHAEDTHPTDGARDPMVDLPWPDPRGWIDLLATSPLVAVRDPGELTLPADAGRDVPPLTLADGRLYLDRLWRDERRVAAALRDRATREVDGVDRAVLTAGLAAFDGPAPDRQRVAAALAVTRHLAIVAGGPGTGKTTTVARILQLLDAQARATGRPRPSIALAAPTGKAAARLTESLRAAAVRAAAPGTGPDQAGGEDRLREATATTLHRLLGARGPGRALRHDRHDPLPHDVVVIDETSMVDLPMLARLLDAARPEARIVLLGDPHQLASVEVGSVLGDVVGDPDAVPVRSPGARQRLAAVAGEAHLAEVTTDDRAGVRDALVVLDRVHRFGATSGLARFATAVRTGDADLALHELATADDLTWIAPSPGEAEAWRWRGPSDERVASVRDRLLVVGRGLRDAAADGDGAAALAALDDVRLLCAHRRGESGVEGWTARAEAWWAEAFATDVQQRWYLGRPVLVTSNDPRLQLWNGDLGVVVRDPAGAPTLAFPAPDGRGVRLLPPARVGEVRTVHAMTVHRSQGSQTSHAVVVLPDPASRICTRELLYTAVTRARSSATVVASETALRATIAGHVRRASGLPAILHGVPSRP